MARFIIPLAGFIEPMLPTLVDAAPDGEAWVHEIKYDGSDPTRHTVCKSHAPSYGFG